MADLLEYKCPCCGGEVKFDSGTQKMVCPFCETEFDVEALKQAQNEMAAGQAHYASADPTNDHNHGPSGCRPYLLF